MSDRNKHCCTEMSDNSSYFHTAFIRSANLADQINILLNRLLSHNINKWEHAKQHHRVTIKQLTSDKQMRAPHAINNVLTGLSTVCKNM